MCCFLSCLINFPLVSCFLCYFMTFCVDVFSGLFLLSSSAGSLSSEVIINSCGASLEVLDWVAESTEVEEVAQVEEVAHITKELQERP